MSSIFCCFTVAFFQSNAQVKAEFTATPVKGCSPLVVKFTDISTGGPTSWFWDLGNGITSVAKNPGAIYSNPGTYTVKLVVQNATSVDSIIKTAFITVSDKPLIKFSASDTIGCNPMQVTFTDLSTAGSGNILQWQWDFGDGNSSTNQNPVNTYQSAGSYNITLKLFNSDGCTNTITKTGYIKVGTTPVASFITSLSSSCNPPVNISFINNSVGSNIVSYNWDFGDGSSSTTINPSHNYTTTGVFNAQLKVTNQTGCSNTTSRLISIGDVKPDFTIPDTVCQNSGFFIYNTSTPATLSAFWVFGDGTNSAQATPYKIYSTPGTFTIKLVNNFGACKDSVSKQIVVLPAPSAAFTYTPSTPSCGLPLTASFNATNVSPSYLWDFGDGSTSTLQSPNHTYTSKGSFKVKLTTKNNFGCVDSVVIQNAIVIADPEITSIDGLPYEGCAPFLSGFKANITTPEPIVNYKWDFGDGGTSSLVIPSYTYTTTGTYNVSLIITTQKGCKDTLIINNAVKIGTKPVPDFTATPTITCGYQSINFTNTSTGNSTAWFWDFGDYSYSGVENPIHTYNDTGFFSVLFVVENNGCIDSIRKRNFIYIKPPVALYGVTHYCDTPYLKTFLNKSKGALNYLWDFGDGTTSTLENPSHTYTSRGSYLVKLRVDNNNCYDEFEDTVYVIDEQPIIAIQPNATCKYQPVNISCTGINPYYFSYYQWTYGDTSSVELTRIPQTIHVYNSSGNYNVTLKTVDRNGCQKIVTQTNGVQVYGPDARLLYQKGACINNSINFTDQSLSYGGFSIVSWTLDYGDGTVVTTNTPVFNHAYTNLGTYDIKYKIKDSKGCVDSLVDSAAVIISKTVASFRISDSISCRQSLIDFTNTSIGSSLSYEWDFGDGTTSIQRSPSHLYSADGIYTIRLKVTDRFGCSDSTTIPNLITIVNPKADFLLSDTLFNCPPAQVKFTNKSTFYTSLQWEFDSGKTSTLSNPTHFYVLGGTYNVKLVVKGYGACIDSMVKQVVVKGPRGTLSYTPLGKCGPATIDFTASASNISSNFTWDFGDGNTLVSSGNTTSHTYVSTGRYLPRLLLRDASLNCIVFVFGSDSISVSSLQANIEKPKALFCDSATVTFFDSSIIRYDTAKLYTWDFGDGTTSGMVNPVHTYTSPGLYNVKMAVNTVFGCADTTLPFLIKVVKSPSVSIAANASYCVNEPINFSVNLALPDTSATKFTWNFGNGITATGANPPTQVYSNAQNYTVRLIAINSSACTDTAIRTIVINPIPVLDAGADTFICRGQSIILNPTGASNYNWQSHSSLSCTGCTNPTARPDSTIKYYVTGSTGFNCSSTDSIIISVLQPFKVFVGQGDTLCKGEVIRLRAGGAINYTWSPSLGLSNISSANPIAKPDNSTRYMVVGSDGKNCFFDTAYVMVVVYSAPFFNIVPEIMNIPAGSSVPIPTKASNDVVKYEWLPTTGLSCADCPQPNVTPVINSTVYKAKVSNLGGCISTDEVVVNMECGTGGSIFIPNTFSPNGDGSNDIFYPRGKGIKGVKNLTIYNRWGGVVFQKTNFNVNDPSAGWDGSYKGQPASSDVYVYHLEILCGTGNQFLYKGDITLIR